MSVKTVLSMDGMQKVLEEMRDLLRLPPQVGESMSIVVTSNTTDWSTYFSPPLFLDPKRKYELALVNLETYNSVPIITTANNTFVYSPDSGVTWKTITVPEGSYEVIQINAEIQRQLEANGDWNAGAGEHYISVGPNLSTLRAFIKIESATYQVDLAASSIRTTLGFNAQTLSSGYHEGENPVDILQVSSILVNCDIVGGSTLSGSQLPVVYSFFPDVSPGFKIVESPKNLVYLPVSMSGNISQIRVRLTDQNNIQLNLRGEVVTIRFHLRSV